LELKLDTLTCQDRDISPEKTPNHPLRFWKDRYSYSSSMPYPVTDLSNDEEISNQLVL